MANSYQGAERRQKQRRQTPDRRVDIRFEPNKRDRRQSTGRRVSDGDVWTQHEE